MEKPINPVYPVLEVRSLDELMNIASSMEREAEERFEELAAEMERLGNHETATLFRTLAEEEREHKIEIDDWAAREHGKPPVRVPFRWRMPETFELDDNDSSVYSLTPHEALSIAVRNEERAFAFYSYLAAIAETDDVRNRAEGLAKGELDHVARLRLRRRQAFHAAHGRPRPTIESVADLHSLAASLELGWARLDEALAATLEAAGDDISATLLRDLAEQARRQVAALADEGAAATRAASETADAARAAGVLDRGALTAQGALCLSLKNAEEIFQTYTDVAEHADQEPVLWAAQRLAEQAVPRLALVSARVQDVV